ncbi:ribosome small subunit-dependent GTPase A [Desulfobacter hydrogenophilus]|uniref:Small ribosomal subunit biogenesis GTPase RsgA n=1 Tax=Desulfobacter hydrogenophilus TaxID=2291 RepID=A0A328FIT1_9BACT|nr:ribosome small subunit-dependent GTPase A [Desulfobacter hydrogenophilus]NDY70746.1 ribosome small subunit-dependent GTPase A [Desulfobacter hydrogenophilus]QBH12643.1 ribosome small subunit-dependent GTPase A [Desulfobacter hydrogenophilus]RAM03392.1 ribosome small subunit-dependent GTPase A [Desulfobacter hydrogenophilus]
MSNEKSLQQDNKFKHLSHLGWTVSLQEQLENIENKSLIPARVTGVRKKYFFINDGKEELLATPAGKLQHDTSSIYPVIGDWVMVRQTAIEQILPRKNTLTRGAAGMRGRKSGEYKEQTIAANLDSVFIVTGLDQDFNLRRIERYLTLVYNCGLSPVIILTKADLHEDPEHFVHEAKTISFGVPVHLVSAFNDSGLSELNPYLVHGRTCVMVGSSGTGKSTLINRLCGETVQATGEVSAHMGKGTHTTTSRDLIMMPQGGMIIDNPGIREITFWEIDQGVESTFPEIEEFAAQCRFSDCTHTHEPGCRVLQAVQDEELTEARLENYLKMKRELEYISERKNKSADRVEKERWKGVSMKIKSINKKK